MDPMFLPEVETHFPGGMLGFELKAAKMAGLPIPQILHNFAFKAERNKHLEHFTQGVMRGPSPLSPGQRELIAALTSRRNNCAF